ncbi:RDD family protein [Nocardia sp. NPDC127579]|uniref:RDD family protein n=1 Tax=Nocardia sp. NPDC127579 TaxID=3345402 RepID=UPI0036316645
MQVPAEAGEGRLVTAALIDATLAPLAAFGILSGLLGYGPGELMLLLLFLPVALGVSFVNHVLGTLVLRGSIGKQVLVLRVVRAKDGGRPGFWRTVGRWLLGFVLLLAMMLAEDGGGIGQAVGVRTIRRRDERNATW